jgi:hypothetical protein
MITSFLPWKPLFNSQYYKVFLPGKPGTPVRNKKSKTKFEKECLWKKHKRLEET